MENQQLLHILLVLTEENVIKVLFTLNENCKDINEIACETKIPMNKLYNTLQKMENIGIIELRENKYYNNLNKLRQELMQLNKTFPKQAFENDEGKYWQNGKLVNWPAKSSTKEKLLNLIANCFEPNKKYAEPEVNSILKEICQNTDRMDYCTLRRYLVDYHLLTRENGVYGRNEILL